ncbi:cytosolic endo-beta-N-acetylglucosaminidase 1-like [Hibiscus syriacus]|uniref:cytosolic endo-beta-N-acetylglucosaminidase 1-like n=1 Tax=Hibiscus syriacus TaxID=106335 RepID=UPI001922A29D|nr:cytosolic endo-beta-N-acetylglucosaminidase 1-like [Hibiscus syriacus]
MSPKSRVLFVLQFLRFFITRKTLVSIHSFLFPIFGPIGKIIGINMPNQSDDQNSNPPPPPFDRAKPSKPISTLEELDSASYITSFHYPFDKSTVPLRLPDSALPPRHRLLVCHDMQGGYVDDNWVQGGNNSGAYAIWHWYLFDVFVYFSHKLATLPPPCWTNTAHRHGVKNGMKGKQFARNCFRQRSLLTSILNAWQSLLLL